MERMLGQHGWEGAGAAHFISSCFTPPAHAMSAGCSFPLPGHGMQSDLPGDN